MNNALWSPRGARAGERNRATGYTPRHNFLLTYNLLYSAHLNRRSPFCQSLELLLTQENRLLFFELL